MAHDISAYSLVALAREAAPLMTDGGSIVAMTYYGAKRSSRATTSWAWPRRAWKRARVISRTISASKRCASIASAPGPMNTLAARGISGFNLMMKHYQERAPLGRSCTLEELGAMGVFLASDGAASITGQVLYVDGGYQIIGM